jgi:hypothetical protein
MEYRSATTRTAWFRFIAVVVTFAVIIGGALIWVQVDSSQSSAEVGWVDHPVDSAFLQSQLPKPLPTPPPQLGAPPCVAANLTALPAAPLGMMSDGGISLALRNDGTSACLLRGDPRLVASTPGAANVNATSGPVPNFGEVTDTAPGANVLVWVEAPDYCPKYPGGAPSSLPVYSHVTVSVPGGGSLSVGGLHLPTGCGLYTPAFFTMKPQPTYPYNPLVRIVPRLRLPVTVRAGTTLSYVVALENPTVHPIRLSPCPGYLENSAVPTKLEYELNCRTVRSIPARAQVTYQMEMAIPITAPVGPTRVNWTLFGASMVTAHAYVRIVK